MSVVEIDRRLYLGSNPVGELEGELSIEALSWEGSFLEFLQA